MEMEQFFTVLSEICLKILPVVGVILLIYLIVFVHRLLGFLVSLNKAVDSANSTIHEAEIQIRKLDGPLQTATEISESVTKVHRLSEHALTTLIQMMMENFSAIKEYLHSILNKEKNENRNDAEMDLEEIMKESASAE